MRLAAHLLYPVLVAAIGVPLVVSVAKHQTSQPEPSGAVEWDSRPRRPMYQYMLTSFYGEPHHGRKTASGEVFDKEALTAAHRTLPFGTVLLVGIHPRWIRVRINDRGPAKWTGRDLDLSEAAARALGIRGGEAFVEVKELPR